ncbi:hypothetical protein CSOJ01_10286 [Colletotrichum sojae]|uniref:Uncharacterized protein n=1 Tax=Colletotrichum sojae TaxID=2175907 RepID=A0A8H6MPF9_9PEZI|nr:hypothetical protein CSOJ01_10286 [Colletotrichum sojae]
MLQKPLSYSGRRLYPTARQSVQLEEKLNWGRTEEARDGERKPARWDDRRGETEIHISVGSFVQKVLPWLVKQRRRTAAAKDILGAGLWTVDKEYGMSSLGNSVGKDRLASAVSESLYLKPRGKKHRGRRRRGHATHDDRINNTTTRLPGSEDAPQGPATSFHESLRRNPLRACDPGLESPTKAPQQRCMGGPPSLKARVDRWHSTEDAHQCEGAPFKSLEPLFVPPLSRSARVPRPREPARHGADARGDSTRASS